MFGHAAKLSHMTKTRKRHSGAARRQVLPYGCCQTELQGIGDQGMANRDLQHLRTTLQEMRQIQEIQIMTGVDTQTDFHGALRRLCIQFGGLQITPRKS
jgi:hypothetical protein